MGALGRIPKVIESHEKEKEKVAANKEIYTAIAGGTWKKEDELRSLKGQAAELDRKIALTITDNKEDSNELTPKSDQQSPPDTVSEHSAKETIVRHKVRF